MVGERAETVGEAHGVVGTERVHGIRVGGGKVSQAGTVLAFKLTDHQDCLGSVNVFGRDRP